jgi:hypothetical protein
MDSSGSSLLSCVSMSESSFITFHTFRLMYSLSYLKQANKQSLVTGEGQLEVNAFLQFSEI